MELLFHNEQNLTFSTIKHAIILVINLINLTVGYAILIVDIVQFTKEPQGNGDKTK